jgi:transposase
MLDDYIGAIHELRQKNFTFREIAEWLAKFGFEVDHNAMWRAYAICASPGFHQKKWQVRRNALASRIG